MFDLNTRLGASGTGWVLAHATGINDLGVIVGTGTFNHEAHAFMATPQAAAEVR
jgi:probable HAF family extracellular repeat protein